MVVTIFTGNSLPKLSKAFLKSIKLIYMYKEDCHSELSSIFLSQLLVQCHLDALQGTFILQGTLSAPWCYASFYSATYLLSLAA